MIKAIIFDMDGTLINSVPIWFHSARRLLAECGSGLTLDEYKFWVGRDETGMIFSKIRETGKPKTKDWIRKRRAKIVSELLKDYRLKADPFLMRLMRLKDRGIKFGLATGTRRKTTRLFLKRLEIDKEFECIISRDEVRRGKPSPDVYLKCSRCLRVIPSECLAFEDSEAGVNSAKAAGMHCIAVPNRFTKHHDFSKADLIIWRRSKVGVKLVERWLK